MKEFSSDKSIGIEYIKKVQRFSTERVYKPLLERELIIDFNSPGENWPEFFVVSDKGDMLFATYEMGEEVWEKYPKTLPLVGGGNFVARAGIEKDDFIEIYLSKINMDPEMHSKILQKLEVYKHKVHAKQINGHKISDWVKQGLWDIIEDEDSEEPKWGVNV